MNCIYSGNNTSHLAITSAKHNYPNVEITSAMGNKTAHCNNCKQWYITTWHNICQHINIKINCDNTISHKNNGNNICQTCYNNMSQYQPCGNNIYTTKGNRLQYLTWWDNIYHNMAHGNNICQIQQCWPKNTGNNICQVHQNKSVQKKLQGTPTL